MPASPLEVITSPARPGTSVNHEMIRATSFEMLKAMARADEERRETQAVKTPPPARRFAERLAGHEPGRSRRPRHREEGMKSAVVAYLLWCLVCFGFAGIRRFYAGKWVSGLIWLFTGGLLLLGQAIDLVLIPGMIREANLRTQLAARR
jgi:TM2 domain-containing membrane protein YozV